MSAPVNRRKKRVRRRKAKRPSADVLAGPFPPLSPARQASIERMVRKVMQSPKVRAENRKMSRELIREVFGPLRRTKRAARSSRHASR